MGSLSAALMAQAAARAWNRPVGLLTGYLLAVYWMLGVFEAEEFAESFSIFFQSLTLWLLIRFSCRRMCVIAAGFDFAFSAGASVNLFLVLPFVLWWLISRHRSGFRAGLQRALLFCIGTVVIISPTVYRNYQISGVPLLRSQATWSLYSGLAPEFEGLHPRPWAFCSISTCTSLSRPAAARKKRSSSTGERNWSRRFGKNRSRRRNVGPVEACSTIRLKRTPCSFWPTSVAGREIGPKRSHF